MKTPNKKFIILFPAAAVSSLTIFLILSLPAGPGEAELELYFRASEAYESGNLPSCITLTDALLKGSPGFFQAGLLNAKALFFSNRFEAAYLRLKKILYKHPDYYEAELWLLRSAVQLEQFRHAEYLAEALLARSPEDPRVLGLLGRLAYSQKDYRAAIEYYSRALLFEETLAVNRIELAKIYSSLLNNKAAEEHLKKALMMLPSDSCLRPAVEIIIEKTEDRNE